MYFFLDNVIAGITASIIMFIFIHIKIKLQRQKKFAYLQGKYFHYSNENEKFGDATTKIIYSKGNIIETIGSDQYGKWKGRINMNEDLPEYGSGVYQYIDKAIPDCGIHQIQISHDKKSINVLTINTSHGKNNTSAYKWVKE